MTTKRRGVSSSFQHLDRVVVDADVVAATAPLFGMARGLNLCVQLGLLWCAFIAPPCSSAAEWQSATVRDDGSTTSTVADAPVLDAAVGSGSVRVIDAGTKGANGWYTALPARVIDEASARRFSSTRTHAQ